MPEIRKVGGCFWEELERGDGRGPQNADDVLSLGLHDGDVVCSFCDNSLSLILIICELFMQFRFYFKALRNTHKCLSL